MKSSLRKALVWTPGVLVSVFMIAASGVPKVFMPNEPFMVSTAQALGMSPSLLLWVGILEIAAAVLFLIPRTSVLGFVLLVGIFGGAIATSVTHTMEGSMWWFPLVMAAILSITAYFTLPELTDRLKGKSVPHTKSKWLRGLGWFFVVLLIAMHAMALMSKINPPTAGQGYDMSVQLNILGLEMPFLFAEVLTLVLFLIPRTSVIGLLLMVGYMAGVLATFLTHGFSLAESSMILVLLAFVAIAGWIRNPELAQRLIKGKYPAKA